MPLSLTQILNLVGKIDDSPGEDTPRERFRKFLSENVNEVGQVKDYIDECLRNSGMQYNRALQDLVNHLGKILGFEVKFGRYQGTKGEIGYDGHWTSKTGFHIVIEVKTTDVYAIKTSTLVGYINGLISEGKIPNWDKAMGLYVIGRRDAELKQLENNIIAEKRINQLRIITVNSLLNMADLMVNYDIDHEDILELLTPPKPVIDPIVDMMSSLVAQAVSAGEENIEEKSKEEKLKDIEEGGKQYWLTPVKGNDEETAEEIIERLVGKEKIYAFGERTPGRKNMKVGDYICFYATGNGIIAHARLKTKPQHKPDSRIKESDKYPWIVELEDTKIYKDDPVIIDAELRQKLDTFKGRDPNKSWAWFVQATRKITKNDFEVLTDTNLEVSALIDTVEVLKNLTDVKQE